MNPGRSVAWARGTAAAIVCALACAAGATASASPAGEGEAAAAATARVGVLTQGFLAQATVDSFTRQLARVGVRVYDPATGRPVLKPRKPVSPFALSTSEARQAALGALAKTGMSGATLNDLLGKVRLGRRARVPAGAIIAGWARRTRTPSARLARRLIGKVSWRRYRKIVFPQAALMLFASDMAVQLRRPGRRTPRAIRSSVGASTSTPCSDALSFVDRNINAFFDWIGHLHTPRSFIEGVFGKGSFGARFLIGVSDYVTGKINGAIDKIRELALDGVRLPIKFVTSAVAGVAATVSAVSKVANMLLPWQASVVGAPNPTRKGVGEGVPGVFVLGVSAPGSSLQWPPEIVDCAKTLANFTLPTTTPRGGVVTWDVSGQYPGGLIRPTGDSGPLNDQGRAQLDFVTTTETEEQAKGDPALGLVVAVAKVHRTDIDELVKLVTDTVFGALPEVIAKHFGPQLRALAKPLVDKIQAKAGTVMDVEDTSRLVVRYHKPPEPPKQRKNPTTGTWTGNWASQIYDGYSGTLVMQIVQDATSLDGTIKIAGSDCVANGNINGRIRDGKIHIGAVQAERSVSFDGQVRGGQMSGRFSAPACGGDSGVWSATKR